MASRKKNTENINEDLLLSSIGKSRTINDVPSTPDESQTPTINVVEEAAKTPVVQEGKSSIVQEEKSKPTERKPPSRTQQAKPQAVDPAEAYVKKYLQKSGMKVKHCAYIDKEDFAFFAKVVRIVTDNEIPIGGYISNILKEHRMTHKDSLNELFRRVHEKGPHYD